MYSRVSNARRDNPVLLQAPPMCVPSVFSMFFYEGDDDVAKNIVFLHVLITARTKNMYFSLFFDTKYKHHFLYVFTPFYTRLEAGGRN